VSRWKVVTDMTAGSAGERGDSGADREVEAISNEGSRLRSGLLKPVVPAGSGEQVRWKT